MRDYELSLWSHKDDFLGLIRGLVEFEGQGYDVIFKSNVNGDNSLSFSIPATIYNKNSFEFEENQLWNYILNEQKIRLIRFKNTDREEIYDFVIKNFVEKRDSVAKLIDVECKSYAIYELSKVGYAANFSEESMLDLVGNEKANIDYWVKKALLYTKNFDSTIINEYDFTKTYISGSLARDPITNYVYTCIKESLGNDLSNSLYWLKYQELNPTGWNFLINTPDQTISESNNVIGFVNNEYDSSKIYYENNYVYLSSTNKAYKSIQNNNQNNLPSEPDSLWWEFYDDGKYAKIYEDSLEKQRVIKVEKSNVFNIIQEIAERFSVWANFKYEYDSFGRTISRKIIFNSSIETSADYTITYGINSKEISKQSDSNELATKVWIENVESDLEASGLMSFSEAPQNLMLENFLYNFDYYQDSGLISEQDNSYIKTELSNSIRNKNLDIIEQEKIYAQIQTDYNKLLADKEFITYEISGCKDLQRDAQIKAAQSSIYDVFITNLIYTLIDRGSYKYIDLSGRKGIKSITSVLKLSDDTPVDYNLIRDSSNPQFIVGIQSNTTELKLKLSYNYNQVDYYSSLLENEIFKESSLNKKLSDIEILVASKEIELENIFNNISLLRRQKQEIIDNFERTFFFAIKEANWKSDSYQLRKEYLFIDSPTIDFLYENTNSYVITTDLNNIDFSTIKIYKSDYLFTYYEKVDYEIKYGVSGGSKVVLIVPIDGGAFTINKLGITGSTLFSENNILKINYNLITTGESIGSDIIINRSTIAQSVKRTFTINISNILNTTIVIIPEDSENPLILNSDYTIENKIDYTVVSFNVTNNCKFLDNVFKIEFYKNITLKFYYNDAEEVAIRAAYPNVSYTINAVDLSSLEGFENFIPRVGQKILINDYELHLINQYGFLSEITFYLDSPEETQFTISNYKTRFEDLFQRIAATTQSLNLRSEAIDRVLNTMPPSKIINPEILQKSVNENSLILSNSLNNDVVWAADGITLTDKSETNKTPGQVKLVGNGIFLSNEIKNGARVWRTGITPSGINANELTAGSINTGKIIIWDETNSRFLWNAEGIFAYSKNLDGTTNFNKYIKFNSDGIRSWNGERDTFKITSEGNAYFMGDITGSNGMFSGTVKIGSGENVFIADSNGIYLGSETFVNAEFSVTPSGKMKLNSPTSTLTIRTDATHVFNVDANGIWLGNDNFNYAPFSVSSTGVLKATTGTFSGSITGATITGSIITTGSDYTFSVGLDGILYAKKVLISERVSGSSETTLNVEGAAHFNDYIYAAAVIKEPNNEHPSIGLSDNFWERCYCDYYYLNGSLVSKNDIYYAGRSIAATSVNSGSFKTDGGGSYQIIAGSSDFGEAALRPNSSGRCNVGTSGFQFDYGYFQSGTFGTSTRDKKENIQKYSEDDAYYILKSIPIYSYSYSESGFADYTIGTIMDYMPLEIADTRKPGSTETYSINNTIWFGLAVSKSLQNKVEKLEERIATLEELIGG